MRNSFSHSGDLGDIIYSLPTIRACGGGTLYLFNIPNRTSHGMNEARANRLRPLLVQQPYIDDVVFCLDASDHNINGFRDHRGTGNLADMHLSTMGLSWEERSIRWLEVDFAVRDYPVVFSRSPRYQNDRFPWKRIYEKYHNIAAFVGFPEEHARFCHEVGPVALAPADNLLEVARLIAGCRLFIGNQSCPAAIAEGLKHEMILEVSPDFRDLCIFQRMNCIIGWDEKIELPSV